MYSSVTNTEPRGAATENGGQLPIFHYLKIYVNSQVYMKHQY